MKNTLPPRVEQNLESQIRVSTRLKNLAASHPTGPVPFVTLSRQFGCEAIALADVLAVKLDETEKLDQGSWQVYSRKLIEAMADEQYSYDQLMSALDSKARGAIEEFVESLLGRISDLRLLHKLVHTMRATATLGRCVIVGRGGAMMTRDMAGGIHVRLVASEEFRLKRLIERYDWSELTASTRMREEDNHRRSFYQKYLHRDASDPELYDLVLNAERMNRDEMAGQILTLFRARR